MKRLIIQIIGCFIFLSGFAQAGTIQDLIDEHALVGYWDFRSGTLIDWSGNNNIGVGTNISWSKGGVSFPVNTSVITVADSAELQLTEGTLVVYSADGFLNQNTANRLIFKRDGGGSDYDFHIDATTIRLYSDGVNLPKPTVVAGHKYVAINMKSTEQCEAFVDGVSIGLFALASSIVQYNAPLYIGSYRGVTNPLQSVLSAALIVNRKLTLTEHSQLYSELSQMVWTTKPWSVAKGVYGPELTTDGDAEAVGTGSWIGFNGATYTKETGNALSGSQVLRIAWGGSNYPYVHNLTTNSLVTGKTYRITGWARGDGAKNPRIQQTVAIWNGTSANNWQYIDFTFQSVINTLLFLTNTTVAGYTEWDDISVREVIHPETRFKSDWGAHIQTNVGGGEPLSDTGAYGGSGNNGLVTDVINGVIVKVVTCAAGGNWLIPGTIIHQPPEQQAYGTWEWWVYRHGATQNIAFVIDWSIQNGYLITLVADNLYLQVLSGGAPTILDSDLSGEFTQDAWYKIRVTRRQRDGLMIVYVNDIQKATATNNTHKTSDMIGFDVTTGDKISWSDVAGGHAIVKQDGVWAP